VTDRSADDPAVIDPGAVDPGIADPSAVTVRSRAMPAVAALLVAASVVAIAALWGRRLIDDGTALFVAAPPFAGRWGWQWPRGLWVAVVLVVVLVVLWVPATERLRWRWVLVGSAVCSAAWSVVLAASAGWSALSAPLTTRFEYLPLARRLGEPGSFIRTFVERLPEYPTHVKGHPPGAVLAFWGLDRIGLSDTGVALVVLVVAASAAPAALIALDRLAGRASARRAAVFVGLAPAVVWVATSADALFMGVAAWAVSLGAIAFTAERGRTAAPVAGAAAGVVAGALLTLTYGAATLLAPLWILAGWAAWRRRWIPLAAMVVGFIVLPGALVLAGFDWSAGLEATRTAYRSGVARDRPYAYFLPANLAALITGVGPAAIVGMAWLRDRRAWLLVGGGVAGVLVADVSGLSKGEVERIWLPLVPFLVLATAAIRGRTARRCWLGAQLVLAVLLQAWLRTPW
jgi:methylthioxylose transferase